MKRLSAKSTFIYKFVMPAGLVAMDLLMLVVLDKVGALQQLPRLPVFIAMALPCVIVFWVSRPLKYVAVEGTTLHVSDYFKEVRIPMTQVRDVVITSGRKQVPRVTLKLSWPSEFGETIDFIPSMWALQDIYALRPKV